MSVNYDGGYMLAPDQLLTTTRAVRNRLDLSRPVDSSTIEECLRIALQAPSRANVQPWHWIVVTDPRQRAAVGFWYARAWRERFEANPDPYPAATIRSARHLADHIADVPVLVIPCLELEALELPTGNQASLWGSLLPAVWSYMLAARARGLGTAWTTVHLAYEREVSAVLDLPDHIRQAALIPTAHAIGTEFRPARRRPLETVLHLDRWSRSDGGRSEQEGLSAR
ncbi:nitroreductase family protein [Micromonospora sp. WMMD967]|uniref:nitroreductase family protein n=1 Tax=Micromonospora sp. WMMD967 TaxID=3016101 RepID=UPI00241796CD|nr:nitroreductase family protein [Micromonospora sp. WMMD967]MDG4836500.1 nitroreductase family protein [Micromonospora sp. WMMD967]